MRAGAVGEGAVQRPQPGPRAPLQHPGFPGSPPSPPPPSLTLPGSHLGPPPFWTAYGLKQTGKLSHDTGPSLRRLQPTGPIFQKETEPEQASSPSGPASRSSHIWMGLCV